MGASGKTTIDFGGFPGASDAAVKVTGQTGIGAGSLVEAWIFPLDTSDHTSDEHWIETIKVTAADIDPGVGFWIYAVNTSQLHEPLETEGPSMFRSAATTVYGYVGPSSGGKGTLIYGKWSVAWVWV